MQYAKQILSFLLLSLFLSGFTHAQAPSAQAVFAEWIVDQDSKEKISVQTATKIVASVFDNAQKVNIDPLLILSIIKAESGFRQRIRNSYGASGLMQVVPKYHKDKIAGRNILQINTNVEVGTTILHDCLVSNNDNFYKAIRCYSGGASSKYIRNIQKTHHALKMADIEMRFSKELPLLRHASWGNPRYLPYPIVAMNDGNKVHQ